MWNLSKKIYWIMYCLFAKNLPISRRSKLFKVSRSFFANKILKKTGENINIEKGAIFNPNVEIGNNSGIGIDCQLNGKVIIGNNVLMGPECIFYTKNHKFKDPNINIIDQGYTEEKEIIIEDDCWIGSRVIVLPGVKISKGMVVGAGSILTKTFPEYSVVAGNPAKIIGKRELEKTDKNE